GEGVCSADIGTTSMNVGAVRYKQFDDGDVTALRGDMQWRVADFCPGKVRIGSVLQQPPHARSSFGAGPAQDVAQRWNASRNAVDVCSETMQQFKRWKVATAGCDVHGNAVGRIGAAFQQHLRERGVIHGNERTPKRGARKLAMPVPVVFAVWV